MLGLGIGIRFRTFSYSCSRRQHTRVSHDALGRFHSATTGDEANEGRGSNGGVWEWTSDVLNRHEGFDPTTIFPGYSEDFFDDKHQVVVRTISLGDFCFFLRLAGH